MKEVFIGINTIIEMKELKMDVDNFLQSKEDLRLRRATAETINDDLDVDKFDQPRVYSIIVRNGKLELNYINLATIKSMNRKFNSMGVSGPYDHWINRAMNINDAFNYLRDDNEQEIVSVNKILRELDEMDKRYE